MLQVPVNRDLVVESGVKWVTPSWDLQAFSIP